VRAGDIVAGPEIAIANPDHLIATLTADVPFHVEMAVGKGRGYVTGSDNRSAEQELGVIPVDSIFSPVLRVRYRTEDMRVGQRTNYDRLIMEVWTNGTMWPEDALVEAGLILRKHLNPFVVYHELGEQVVTPLPPALETDGSEDSGISEILSKPVSVLNLSARASNCLVTARINTVGDLVARTEADLLRFRSFGRTSLHEVHRKLTAIGLSLGTQTDEGDPDRDAAGPVAPDSESTDEASAGPVDNPSVPAGAGPLEACTMED
jgi:DNA-directed RNA polymerase subunit alpha